MCQTADNCDITMVAALGHPAQSIYSAGLMLGLHYVPGGHGSPVCPKRSAPWDFGNFFSVFKLC